MNYAKDVKKLQRWLPNGYRKHQARLSASFGGSVSIKSYWDGGTKDEYELRRLADGQFIKSLGINPWGKDINDPKFMFVIPEGHYVLEHGTFCGKPATATLKFRNETDLNLFIQQHQLVIES